MLAPYTVERNRLSVRYYKEMFDELEEEQKAMVDHLVTIHNLRYLYKEMGLKNHPLNH